MEPPTARAAASSAPTLQEVQRTSGVRDRHPLQRHKPRGERVFEPVLFVVGEVMPAAREQATSLRIVPRDEFEDGEATDVCEQLDDECERHVVSDREVMDQCEGHYEIGRATREQRFALAVGPAETGAW